ncbi:hypothetical protein, partial [Humitalea rosea]|uniref:hypothetical protein n=1 Tax=Humitalea rosea TaxID=990373 RepID=UPI002482D3F8
MSARAFSTSWPRRSSSRSLRSCALSISLAVRALWKLLPPADGVGSGSGMGGATTAGRGGAGGGEGEGEGAGCTG